MPPFFISPPGVFCVRGPKNAKARKAFARLAFGGSPVRNNGRCPMRKQPYLRIRRVLEITKVFLIIVLLILTIVAKL